MDDGSTDDSCRISEEFCDRNKNWKLFHLKHVGVSRARSYAIGKSCGKYLSFVDSDDFVEPDFLEILHKNIKNSQISMCNYDTCFGNSRIHVWNPWFHKAGTFSRNEILNSLILDISIKSFLWNKLFEKRLFDNITIPDMCFEDKFVCLQVFSKIKKCTITKKILYHYNKNVSSLTWEMNENTLNDYIKFSEFLRDFFVSKNEYNIFKTRHKMFCIHVFSIIFKVLFHEYIFKTFNIKMFFKKLIKNFKRIISSLLVTKKN